MKKYTAIQDFYKVSEGKNYKIGDTIELDDDTAKAMKDFVVEVKESKAKK